MLFLFLTVLYIVALGAGTMDISFLAIFSFIATIVGLLVLMKRVGGYLSVIILVFCGVGWNIGMSENNKNIENWREFHAITDGYTKKISITGNIRNIAYTSDFSTTYRLYIDTIDTISTRDHAYTIFLEIPKNLSLGVNDIVGFTGKIQSILTYPLTGFERYAWKDGVVGKIHLNGFELLNKGNISYFERMQKWSESVLFHGFPRDTAALILGMTIGNTELLSRGLKEDFMLSGMTHILVVSGSNIAFVILFILFFLKYTRATPWIRMGIIVLFVLLYGTLVGWDAPVVRATCMGILTYISLQFQTKFSSTTLLLTIGAIYISLYPLLLIFDAGFGLSFGATFGILLFHKKFSNFFTSIKIPQVLGTIFAVTFGAMLGSLPIMVYQFGTISIGGILANILIAPILGPLLFLCVGYLSLAGLGVSSLYYPGFLLYFPSKFILEITSFFAGGIQVVIPEYLKTNISLFLIGFLIITLFLYEYQSLIVTSQIKTKHPKEDLIKEGDHYQNR